MALVLCHIIAVEGEHDEGTYLTAPGSEVRACAHDGGRGHDVRCSGPVLCRSEADATAKPTPQPDRILKGGGWRYTKTETGACGSSTIEVNDDGGGKLRAVAVLRSLLGAMTEGAVTIIWNGGGKAGSKTWEPKGVDWTSPVTSFTVPQHEEITVLVTGYVTLADGDDCSIENPFVRFTAS